MSIGNNLYELGITLYLYEVGGKVCQWSNLHRLHLCDYTGYVVLVAWIFIGLLLLCGQALCSCSFFELYAMSLGRIVVSGIFPFSLFPFHGSLSSLISFLFLRIILGFWIRWNCMNLSFLVLFWNIKIGFLWVLPIVWICNTVPMWSIYVFLFLFWNDYFYSSMCFFLHLTNI